MIDGKRTDKCNKYSIASNVWTECQPVPRPALTHANSTVAVGKKIYLLAHKDFFQYDIASDQWSELPPPPVPSYYCAMVLHRGYLVVTGGCEGHGREMGQKPNAGIKVYDPASRQWMIEDCSMPLPLSMHSACVIRVPQTPRQD